MEVKFIILTIIVTAMSFALINLLVIIFFIIVLILKYKDINKISYYLMIPYLLWSCYALILNFSLLILN